MIFVLGDWDWKLGSQQQVRDKSLITKLPDSLFCWGLGVGFHSGFYLHHSQPNLRRSDYPKRQGVFLILHAYLMTFPRSVETTGAGWCGTCSTHFGRPKNIPKLFPQRIRKIGVRQILWELDVSKSKYCVFACCP